MRPPSFRKHHRFSLLLLPLFIIASRILVVDGAKTLKKTNIPACPSLNCGGVLIEYPFGPPMGLGNNSDRVLDSDYYCGYRDLRVTCEYEQPIFKTLTDSYIVKGINYTTKTISLVDADVLGKDCPRVNNSLNISNKPILSRHSSDVDLLFFFNCSQQNPQIAQNEVACLSPTAGISYVFSVADLISKPTLNKTLTESCRGSVNSTVLWKEWDSIRENISGLFGTVLQKGFDLQWEEPISSDCIACENSGGYCGGYEKKKGSEGVVFTCFCSNDCSHGGLTPWQIFLIALSVFGFVVIVAIVAVCFKCSRRRKLKDDDAQQITSADSLLFSAVKDDDAQQIISADSLLFDSATINLVTENFSESNKLGQGGFGVVYKGILPNKQEIAVKLLSSSSNQGMEELRNEVSLLAKLKHKNLVQLLGFCVEGQDKCLIYAYVNNQSLDKFFLDPVKRERLCWEKRYKIIKGIARGMLYLHEESHVKIIHRDLKASNILLDSDMNPKISDFGLARMFDVDQTKEMTRRIAGTFGYMAPEYVTNGHFSNKSDVFSFGVLVLEILMGQRNSNFNRDGNEATNLLTYVWENWRKRAISSIVDPSLGMNYAMDEALRCVEIGLLCVQESPNDRITMATVVLMLNNCPISVTAPSRPAFLFDCRGNETFNIDTKRDEDQFDRNELSITELGVR